MKAMVSLVLAVLFFTSVSFGFDQVTCPDYFKYNGVEFKSFNSDKTTYNQGDTVTIRYEIRNGFTSPLPEGALEVLVFYRGPENVDRPEDDDLIDQFFAFKDVELQVDERRDGVFGWTIPGNTRPGYYVISAYYTVAERTYVSGVPVVPAMVGSTASFEVRGGDRLGMFLVRNETFFNDDRYQFREPPAEIQPGKNVSILTYLSNKESLPVEVSFEVFDWDDTWKWKRYDVYSKKESVESDKALSYDVKGLPPGGYTARITASSGELKSILKVRFRVLGCKGGFPWFGLTRFPLNTGESTSLAACFTNVAGTESYMLNCTGTSGKMILMDASGRKIAEEGFNINNLISTQAVKMDYAAQEPLNGAVIRAELYAADGTITDSLELKYGVNKGTTTTTTIKDAGTTTTSIRNVQDGPGTGDANSNLLPAALLAAVLIAVALVFWFRQRKKQGK